MPERKRFFLLMSSLTLPVRVFRFRFSTTQSVGPHSVACLPYHTHTQIISMSRGWVFLKFLSSTTVASSWGRINSDRLFEYHTFHYQYQKISRQGNNRRHKCRKIICFFSHLVDNQSVLSHKQSVFNHEYMFYVVWLTFSTFSMFSQLTPCSPNQHASGMAGWDNFQPTRHEYLNFENVQQKRFYLGQFLPYS